MVIPLYSKYRFFLVGGQVIGVMIVLHIHSLLLLLLLFRV